MAVADPMNRRGLGLVLLLSIGCVGYAQPTDPQIDAWSRSLEAAQRSFDDSALDRLIQEAKRIADQSPERFEVQHLLSRVYLVRCDLRRFKRKTYDLSRKEDKALRKEQEELAKGGAVYAERAVALEPDSSEAHRVLGELWIHQITGPISGIRFGPKGKDSIEKAIQLDPQNLEARRALGLMYLYNPPFNGGDKDKAAETFDQLSEAGGGDRCYVLAARAYLEKEDPARARPRLQKALELNPDNLEAEFLLKELTID